MLNYGFKTKFHISVSLKKKYQQSEILQSSTVKIWFSYIAQILFCQS